MSEKHLSKFISKTFIQGLAIVLPVAAAVYILVWIFRDTEKATKALLLKILPESLYVPGLGILVLVSIIFSIGLLMYPWLTRKLFGTADRLFRQIPLFGSVYSPVKDLFNLFGGSMTEQLGEPVMVKVPNTEMETLGFITRKSGAGLPPGMIPDGHLVVYVQWSSQIGGYCFVVPEDSVRRLDLTVEEGLRWSLTAGLSGPSSKTTE